MKNKISGGLFGLLVLAFGVIFLGNNFGWWEINLFFKGWWTVFIIVPCALNIVEHGFNMGNIIGLGVGVFLLLVNQTILPEDAWGKIFLPAIVILVGLSIVVGTFRSRQGIKHASREGIASYTAILSGNEEHFPAQPFHGARVFAFMGGVELDLRNALIEQDIVIDLTTILGGADIFLPAHVNVKVRSTPILGGISNHHTTDIVNAPTVYINGMCVLGGADIK